MNRESTARNLHRSGNNCAASVYKTFADKVNGQAPLPRAEGGKCGAYLAARNILIECNKDPLEAEKAFTENFGSISCADLRKTGVSCNDLVAFAAALVERETDA